MLRSGGAEALRVNGWGIVMEVEKDGEGNDEAGTFGSGAAAIAKVVVLFKSSSSAIESLFWCPFDLIARSTKTSPISSAARDVRNSPLTALP